VAHDIYNTYYLPFSYLPFDPSPFSHQSKTPFYLLTHCCTISHGEVCGRPILALLIIRNLKLFRTFSRSVILFVTGGTVYAVGSLYKDNNGSIITGASFHGVASSCICIAGKCTSVLLVNLLCVYACSVFSRA